MNERLIIIPFAIGDPDNTAAVGDSAWLQYIPFNITIIFVTVAPMEDDTGATIDIQDDTTDIITAIDASDHDVPGTWKSTHMGGTNTPVAVAAGSELEIDINNAAAANRFDGAIWALVGEVSS